MLTPEEAARIAEDRRVQTLERLLQALNAPSRPVLGPAGFNITAADARLQQLINIQMAALDQATHNVTGVS